MKDKQSRFFAGDEVWYNSTPSLRYEGIIEQVDDKEYVIRLEDGWLTTDTDFTKLSRRDETPSEGKHCVYCDKCVTVGESLKCKRLGGERYLDLPEERSCICFKDARGVWQGTIKEAEERFNERKVESLCYLPPKKYDEDNGEQPKFDILDEVICDGEEGKGRIFKIGCKEEYGYKYWVKFDNGRECWCAGRGLHLASATTDAVNSPKYYNRYSVEVVEMARRIWGDEAMKTAAEITAFIYRMRAGVKPDNPWEQDIGKEEWWLNYRAKI